MSFTSHLQSRLCQVTLDEHQMGFFVFLKKKKSLLLTLRTKVQNMHLYICNSQGHPNVHMLNSMTLHKERFGKHMKQYHEGL